MSTLHDAWQPLLAAMNPIAPVTALMKHGLEACDLAATRGEEGTRQMLDFWTKSRHDAMQVMVAGLDALAIEGVATTERVTEAVASATRTSR
jgi:hypothetical protein